MNCRTTTTRSVFSSLALLLCVSATLAGCKSGGGGSSSSSAPIATSASSTPVVTSTPAPASTPDPVTAPESTPAPEQNSAPKISGSTIESVTVNSLYSFKPAASDPDGDTLAFQIQNKPAWATFSTVTGQLAGTPAAAGTFANIVISVNDGAVTTAMPAFSIAVTNPTVNSAKLTWAAPTENTDGSALSDLAGFTIVYGTSQASLDQTVRIDNATASTYTLDNFPSGTYYFAIKAFTAGGAESVLSQVVTKAFN